MNTHGQKLEIFCQREPWFHGIKFWIRKKSWSPERMELAYALPLVFEVKTVEQECQMQPEAFNLHDEQAQNFMDELWRVGFRPTEGSGSAGSLAATERHLADMRALVFKLPETKTITPVS